MSDCNIVAYVAAIPGDAIVSIRAHAKRTKTPLRIMLIRDSRLRSHKEYPDIDILLECDLSKPDVIATTLLPYQDELLAITCRTEPHMESFAKIIPHVPYLRTPTAESLHWSTDKLAMRKRLRIFDKKNTPVFAVVGENTKKERARIAAKVGFPLIIKPANLAQSMLVSICYHEEEFEQTLSKALRKITRIYEERKLERMPTMIAEQFMDGDMYSIDGYVTARGKVYTCPIIKVLTGRAIGRDDFSNYLHTTVHSLKRTTVARAEKVTETAVHALGLRSTTFHAELMKVDDEWKIIEVGPRVGGFRPKLYELAYGIDHSFNDVLVRIPQRPLVPKKKLGYATALKYYPKTEGVITELKGTKKIQELKSFHSINVLKKVGDRSRFATSGGTAVFNVILFNTERSKLLADVRRVEQLVKITVR